MAYSDEQLTTIYYEDQPVLYIEEKFDGKEFKTDMRVFIVYDKVESLFYVYGTRRCKKNHKYIDYILKYETPFMLFNYLKVAMNTVYNKVNVTGYFLSGLTSDDTFDDFSQKTSRSNELFGYDNMILKRKEFNSMIHVLNTGAEYSDLSE